MRFILSLAYLIGIQFICFAQDSEFTDYRKKTDNFSHIYDKEIRSDLASFTIGGIEESLGKSPLKKMDATKYGDDNITYEGNGIQITIHGAPFEPSKHKLMYENKHLVRIDAKGYYGNYGKLPTTRIAQVIVTAGKDTIPVPPNAFADLYNPRFTSRNASGEIISQNAVYISGDKRKIYIYMLNKDDTGSYEVTWIIQDQKYLRRVIDFGFSK